MKLTPSTVIRSGTHCVVRSGAVLEPLADSARSDRSLDCVRREACTQSVQYLISIARLLHWERRQGLHGGQAIRMRGVCQR
jgi:hypothetical protein